MTDVVWYPGLTVLMDPNSVEDVYQDWTGWLEGETFHSDLPPVIIDVANLTSAINTITGNVLRIRVSAPTDPAHFTVRATSSSGRVTDRTTYIQAQQL